VLILHYPFQLFLVLYYQALSNIFPKEHQAKLSSYLYNDSFHYLNLLIQTNLLEPIFLQIVVCIVHLTTISEPSPNH